MACIAGLQYLPPAAWFAHWLHHGSMVIEGHEHYQKRTFRNRTALVAPQHPVWLTVPLRKGKHQQMPIRDVAIAYEESWAHNHIHALQAAYGKTAFAEEVLPLVYECVANKHETLWTLNLALINLICNLLPGDWNYTISETYIRTYPGDPIDLRSGIKPGTSHLDSMPSYPQVQRLQLPFQANLTILDMLCHLGPQSRDYLARYAAQLYAHS